MRIDQRRINYAVNHKYFIIYCKLLYMYISYMKTWIKKLNCILIKHDERIKKGLYYHKGGGGFFHRKNTLSDKYET